MPSNYAKNKQHIYRYRETHLEKCREICRRYKSRLDKWRQAQRIYLGILRDV